MLLFVKYGLRWSSSPFADEVIVHHLRASPPHIFLALETASI